MPSSDAFALKPGEARGAGPLNIFGDLMWIKLTAADTGGGVSIMETVSPPQVGPPLHKHSREDEWFYVLDGEYLVEVDGKQITVGPGGSAFAPRGTVHTFQNISSSAGRILVVAQPGGIDVFFGELAAATMDMRAPDLGAIIPLFEKHGLQLMGPPLGARQAAATG